MLQLQLKEAQGELYDTESALKQSVMFCGTLLERLEDLVKFLTSLLQSKDISHELQKAITLAVDKSLNLSNNLNSSQITVSQNISEMSMMDLVNSYTSSTIADSMVDSLENFSFKMEHDSINKALKCNTQGVTSSKSMKKSTRKSLASSVLKHQSELDQESEVWSEPDRDCSRERIGLSTADESRISMVPRTSTTSDDEEDLNDFGGEHKLVRKSEWRLIQEKIKSLESLLQEKNNKILEISGMLLESENDTKDKILQIRKKLDESEHDIQHYKSLYHQVTSEKCELMKNLHESDEKIELMKKEKEKANVELKILSSKYESQKNKFLEEETKLQSLRVEYEIKCTDYDQLVSISEKREQSLREELQQNWVRKTVYSQLLHELDRKQTRLKDYQQKFASLESEMKIMQSRMVESEEKLDKISKNLDTATLQLSAASVERSKAINDKRSLEMKLKKFNEDHQRINIEKQELNLKIADLEVFNAKLHNKLLIGDNKAISIVTQISSGGSGYVSEDAHVHPPRSLSFSSNDDKEKDVEAFSNCMSCKKLANEINEIKRSLNVSKKSLEMAYMKLRNQNLRKAQIEIDIKEQIAKTQIVLQNVKENMANITRVAPRSNIRKDLCKDDSCL